MVKLIKFRDTSVGEDFYVNPHQVTMVYESSSINNSGIFGVSICVNGNSNFTTEDIKTVLKKLQNTQ